MNFWTAFSSLSQDQLVTYAIPVFILAIGMEYWIAARQVKNLYSGRDLVTSIGIGLLTLLVELLPKVLAFMGFFTLHQYSPFREIVGRQWWAWILLFFLDDLTYYWFHRLNHQMRILWAGHVAHHSSVFLNFGTALRQGVGERLHKFLFWTWLPFLGFDPLMVFTMISISLIYQFWVHTELIDRLPKWVEAIFNTPSHHRVHHASNVIYLDCNHAGVLIIWDRLFGTFSPELSSEKPLYGLTKNIESYRLDLVATHEYSSLWRDFKRARLWSDKLKYLFWAPGWSHDGPDMRSSVLRSELARKK